MPLMLAVHGCRGASRHARRAWFAVDARRAHTEVGAGAAARVAVLYQHAPPPQVDGIVKPMKPGGYSDSGADIAFALSSQPCRAAGVHVVTPAAAAGRTPVPEVDLDWVSE